ncbi:MAG: YIP1 family protein [Acidobacteria bacterium]|nr:YIP1 family protein [Acidobacteriota bacterium]
MSDASLTTPPQPSSVDATSGAATMSTPETLANIFFEPGPTFEALRARPRFLVAALIIVALTVLVTVLLFQKVSFEQVVREAIDKSPRTQEMSAEQKEQIIAMQTGPGGKAIGYGAPLIGTVVILAAGAALYLLGAMMMGGKLSYKQALSVWTYSSFPPAVLGTVLALVMLFIKSPEDLDFNRPGAGLIVTNLGVLIGPEGSKLLRAALGWFDLFTFYGMFLAALGLRKVGKLSSGGAWTIVITLWLIGMILSVARTALFGG